MFVVKFLNVVSSYYPLMENSSLLIAKLDTLYVLTHVSFTAGIPNIRLMIIEKEALKLVNCRHPVLEVNSKVDCIPNSVEMKKENLHCI